MSPPWRWHYCSGGFGVWKQNAPRGQCRGRRNPLPLPAAQPLRALPGEPILPAKKKEKEKLINQAAQLAFSGNKGGGGIAKEAVKFLRPARNRGHLGQRGREEKGCGVQPPAPGDAGLEGAEGSWGCGVGGAEGEKGGARLQRRASPGAVVCAGAERARARPLWGPPRVPRSGAGCSGLTMEGARRRRVEGRDRGPGAGRAREGQAGDAGPGG